MPGHPWSVKTDESVKSHHSEWFIGIVGAIQNRSLRKLNSWILATSVAAEFAILRKQIEVS